MKSSVTFERATESVVLRRHGVRDNSVGDAINDIKELKAKKVHSLLVDMLDAQDTFPIPNNQVLQRIMVMYLAQKDRAFAIENKGEQGLIPFNAADFSDALEYAKQYEESYRSIWFTSHGIEETTVNEETGEVEKVQRTPGKRGRKGDAYAKVAAFLSEGDNSKLAAKDAAKKISDATGVAETTALQYTYKWMKENGLAPKKGKRGRKATIYPKVVEFMTAHPEYTKAKDAAIAMEKELGIAKGTATAYAHKFLKENR